MPDPYLLFCIVAGSLALGYMGYAFLGMGNQVEELEVQLEDARQDSIRFADIIARNNELTARGDSIAQRVAIIQEIDAGRYVWPHVLDEVSTALPDYTWLYGVVQTSSDPVRFLLNGRAGSNNAVTAFMRQLEASPFLRQVDFQRSEQAVSAENQRDIIVEFDLEITFEPPGFDELETVPLFDDALSAQTAVPDTTGR